MDTDIAPPTPIITQTTYIYDSPQAMFRHLLLTLSSSESLYLKSLAFTLKLISKVLPLLARAFEWIPEWEVAGVNLRVFVFTVFLGWFFMNWIKTGFRLYFKLLKIWCIVVVSLFMMTFVTALLGGNVNIVVETNGRGSTSNEPLVIQGH
jgi:hypothetical protein